MLINIFGKRGSGKTHLIGKNLESFPGPVAVIDILGNFASLTDKEENPLYPVTDSISEFISWLEDYDPEDSLEKVFILTPADPGTAVDFVSAGLWEIHGGTLVLDEVDAFNPTDAPCFDQLIRYGRNRNVHLITGCRRPAEISRNITAGANRIYVYQTQEPRDIEYFEATILGKDAEKLISLPKYHGLFIDYDEGVKGNFRVDDKGKVFTMNKVRF